MSVTQINWFWLVSSLDTSKANGLFVVSVTKIITLLQIFLVSFVPHTWFVALLAAAADHKR